MTIDSVMRCQTGRIVAALVVGCLLSLPGCAASIPKSAGAPAPTGPVASPLPSLPSLKELRPREDLPIEVREMLSARMERHGEQMTDLLMSVVMVEYELVRHFAGKLGAEPKLGRPAKGETGTINAMLPSAFFVHQDELAESARALARAAEARDESNLGQAFGAVTKSCVGCHSVYQAAEFEEFDHDEPSDDAPCELGGPCDYRGSGARESARESSRL